MRLFPNDGEPGGEVINPFATANGKRGTWGFPSMMAAAAALTGCGQQQEEEPRPSGGGGSGRPAGDSGDGGSGRPAGDSQMSYDLTTGTVIRPIDVSGQFNGASGPSIYSGARPDGDSIGSIGLFIDDRGMIRGEFTGTRDEVIEVTAETDNGPVTYEFLIRANSRPTLIRDNPLDKPLIFIIGESITAIEAAEAFEDSDGDSLTYSATVGGGAPLSSVGLAIGQRTGRISGTFTSTSDVTVTVTASDGVWGGDVVLSLEITARSANVDEGIENLSFSPGQSLNFKIPEDAFAFENDPMLTYSAEIIEANGSAIPIGEDFSDESVSIVLKDGVLRSRMALAETDASRAGDGNGWKIRLTASDGNGNSASVEFTVEFGFPTGAGTVLPSWLTAANEYGIGFDSTNVANPINGVHSLTDSDEDGGGSGAEHHWKGEGRYDESVSLTWSFVPIGSLVYRGSGSVDVNRFINTTEEFTDGQKGFIRKVFNHVESISDIRLTEVDEQQTSASAIADIRVILGSRGEFRSNEGVLGFTYAPTEQGRLSPLETTTSRTASYIGDIYIVSDTLPDDAYSSPFGEENYVISHELLHGLGLDHPFREGASGAAAGFHGYHESGSTSDGLLIDVRNYQGVVAGGGHDTPVTDTYIETIMTYHNPFSGSPLRVHSEYAVEPDNNDIWEPSIYDIAALQHLYGANMRTNSDDTTYDFDSGELIYRTIWDGGGTDTITHSGGRNAIINLNPGEGSVLGFFGGATYRFSAEEALPRGTVWERFELDEESDGMVDISIDGKIATFIPNLAADGLDETLEIRYSGDASGDSASRSWHFPTADFVDRSYATHNVAIAFGVVIENAVGGGGDDRIIGNSANNRLTGGAGADTFEVIANPIVGVDVITDFNTVENDVIEFNGFSIGDVRLEEDGEGNAQFIADGMRLTLTGVSRNDLSAQRDYVFMSDLDTNRIFVQGDDNVRFGSLQNDIVTVTGNMNTVSGSGGDDTITGIGDMNNLRGGPGRDTLIVSGTDNILFGGSGRDTFRITPGSRVEIEDFSFFDGDVVELVEMRSSDITEAEVRTRMVGSREVKYFIIEAPLLGTSVEFENVGVDLRPGLHYRFSRDLTIGAPPQEGRFTTGTEVDPIHTARFFVNESIGDTPVYTAVLGGGVSLHTIGLTIDDHGVITSLPGGFTGMRDGLIEITASGANGSSTSHYSFEANSKPTTTAQTLPPQSLTIGAPISPIDVSGHFMDADGDSLEFSATVGEDRDQLRTTGLSINRETGLITGNFTSMTDVTINVKASDGAPGGEVTVPLKITANPAPMVVGGVDDQILRGNEVLNVEIPENIFADSDNLTYAAAVVDIGGTATPIDGSPASGPFVFEGNMLTTPTPLAEADPSNAGAGNGWTIRIIATDEAGGSASTEFRIESGLPSGVGTATPSWLDEAPEYGIGYVADDIDNPINGVHSLTDSDSDNNSEALEHHWNGSGSYGESVELTWSFAAAGDVHTRPGGADASRVEVTVREEFSDTHKEFIRGVFTHLENFADIDFREVTDSETNHGDIRIVLGSADVLGISSGVVGFSFPPSELNGMDPIETKNSRTTSYVGDIFIVNDHLPEDAYEGDYGDEHHVFASQLLRALGLDDPFNRAVGPGAGSQGYHETAGGLANYHGAKTGGAYETPLTDTRIESIMARYDPFAGSRLGLGMANDHEIVPHFNDVWMPGVYDIAALQHLYGANTDIALGNTLYPFSDEEIVYQTIWDGGGTDTIIQEGVGDATINLNPGTGSVLGFFGGSTYSFVAEDIAKGNPEWRNLVGDAVWEMIELDEESDGRLMVSEDNGTATFIPNLAADGVDDGVLIQYTLSGNGMEFEGGWNFPSSAFGNRTYATHNVAIAHGVVIENAMGGVGDDRIIGNSADNMLTGGLGADTFEIVADPVAGNDTITDFDVDADDVIEFIGFASGDDVTLANNANGHAEFTAFGMRLTLVNVSAEDLVENQDYSFRENSGTNRIINGDGAARFGILGDDRAENFGNMNHLNTSDGDDTIISTEDFVVGDDDIEFDGIESEDLTRMNSDGEVFVFEFNRLGMTPTLNEVNTPLMSGNDYSFV